MPIIRNHFLFTLFPLLFLLFAPVAGCLSESRVDFTNRTDKAVREGHLDVGGRVFDLAGISPGESRVFSCTLSVRQPFDYAIELTLADGRRAMSGIGPARAGKNCQVFLTVEKDRLVMESRETQGGCGAYRSTFSQEKPLKWISVR
jgi:hypothetical protein